MDREEVALAVYTQCIAGAATDQTLTDLQREKTAVIAFAWADAFMKVAQGDSKVTLEG